MFKRIKDVTELKVGTEFEGTLIDLAKIALKKAGRPEAFKSFAGTDVDRFEGSDCEIDGVRVDFTAAFSHKNFTEVSDVVIATRFVDIHFGVRTGNGHVTFQKPVVVVGCDLNNSFFKKFEENIIDELKKHVDEIIDTISDIFWDFVDERGLEF